VHPQSMNQSLDEAFELGTIQWFSIDVVRVEVADASLNSFPAGSADIE